MSKRDDETLKGMYESIKENMKKTEKRRFDCFVANGDIVPVNEKQLKNAIKWFKEEYQRKTKVFFCNYKTRQTIIDKCGYIPYMEFILNENVPDDTVWAVTDEKWRKRYLEEIRKGDI